MVPSTGRSVTRPATNRRRSMSEVPVQALPSGPPPDPRRFRIRWRLGKLVGPGPAAFYRDACDLMDDPTRLHSTSHLVGHLIREIESALRAVLSPMASPPGVASGAKGKG